MIVQFDPEWGKKKKTYRTVIKDKRKSLKNSPLGEFQNGRI